MQGAGKQKYHDREVVILRLSTGGSMKAQVSVFVVRNFNKGARWMP